MYLTDRDAKSRYKILSLKWSGLTGHLRLQGVHILLVEDDHETRDLLSDFLTRSGHEVSAAETVRDALLLLGNLRFHVLVSDIGLPDGNGYALVSEAKKRQPIRAVALTTRTTEADEAKGRHAGFDEYLTKPIDYERLSQALVA